MSRPSLGARGVSRALIGLGSVALVVAIAGIMHQPPLNKPKDIVAEDVPPGIPGAVTAFVEDNSEVLATLGKQGKALDTYEQLVRLWSAECSLDPPETLKRMVYAFPDHALGLYALNDLIASGADSAGSFSEEVVAAIPQSRVASLALDHLLQAFPRTRTERCDEVWSKLSNTRVAGFARMRKGDFLYESHQGRQAAVCWLEAWFSQPDMGEKLYNKIYGQWISEGMWWGPLLIGGEFLNEPALKPLIGRLLAEYKSFEAGESTFAHVKKLMELSSVLANGNTETLTSAIGELLVEWPTFDWPEVIKAESALAVYLLGGSTDRTFPLSTEKSLTVRNKLHRDRMACLSKFSEAFRAVEPDLGALYSIRVSSRFLEDIQPKQAAEFLRDKWQTAEASIAWRERLLKSRAAVLTKELGDHETAASECEQYCDSESEHSAEMHKWAGIYCYDAKQYARALHQFEQLEAQTDDANSRAMALFMKGMSAAASGQVEMAEKFFLQLNNQFPASEFAPEALAFAAKTCVAGGDYARAKQYLNEIHTRYPDWLHTEEYARLAEVLKDAG